MDIIYTIWLRNVKRYLRSRSRIIGSLGMPLFLMLVLGAGLGPSLSIQGQGYNKFLIPGIVSMTLLFASMASGIMIIWDKQFGFLKETLVAPVTRFEIMVGQTVGGATTSLIQGFILVILSLFISGFPSITGLLIALVFMILIGMTFTALGISFASRMEDMHGFQLINNFIVFPIFGLSGALFPLANLPKWLQFLTRLDPLTYGVEGIRFGLLGSSQINPITCFIVLSLSCLGMMAIGGYLFQKIKI